MEAVARGVCPFLDHPSVADSVTAFCANAFVRLAESHLSTRHPSNTVGIFVASPAVMPDDELDDATIVPLTSETEAERTRIRRSNDRDQQLEREGVPSPHNKGYDEVVDFGRRAADNPQWRPLSQSTVPGADINADWESAANAGDEAPGGDNPALNQEISHASKVRPSVMQVHRARQRFVR